MIPIGIIAVYFKVEQLFAEKHFTKNGMFYFGDL